MINRGRLPSGATLFPGGIPGVPQVMEFSPGVSRLIRRGRGGREGEGGGGEVVSCVRAGAGADPAVETPVTGSGSHSGIRTKRR